MPERPGRAAATNRNNVHASRARHRPALAFSRFRVRKGVSRAPAGSTLWTSDAGRWFCCFRRARNEPNAAGAAGKPQPERAGRSYKADGYHTRRSPLARRRRRQECEAAGPAGQRAAEREAGLRAQIRPRIGCAAHEWVRSATPKRLQARAQLLNFAAHISSPKHRATFSRNRIGLTVPLRHTAPAMTRCA